MGYRDGDDNRPRLTVSSSRPARAPKGGGLQNLWSGAGEHGHIVSCPADVRRQQQPNSWMVAFDPTLDVAIGCVVLDAGYGVAVAGPEAATALQLLTQSRG